MPNQTFQHSDLRRISLPDFVAQSRKYLTAITSNQQAIRDLVILFGDGQEIWPDQCEYGVSTLVRAQVPIKAFCALLDTSAFLPVSVVPLRYPLLVTLHHLDEQINATLTLISEFCSIRNTPSKRLARKHFEVRGNLTSLLNSSEDLLRLTQDLIDQTQFEERRLVQASFPQDGQAREGSATELRRTDDLQSTSNITYLTLAQRRQQGAGESEHFS